MWPPTLALAFIAYSNVENDVRAGLLALSKLADAQIARDLALVFRKDKALSRAALAFIDIAVKLKTPQAAGAPNNRPASNLYFHADSTKRKLCWHREMLIAPVRNFNYFSNYSINLV